MTKAEDDKELAELVDRTVRKITGVPQKKVLQMVHIEPNTTLACGMSSYHNPYSYAIRVTVEVA